MDLFVIIGIILVAVVLGFLFMMGKKKTGGEQSKSSNTNMPAQDPGISQSDQTSSPADGSSQSSNSQNSAPNLPK